MKIRIENVAEPGEAPVSVLVRDQGTPLSTQYDLQVGESRDLTLYEGAELYLVSWRAQSFIEIDPSSGQPTEKKDVYPEKPSPTAPWAEAKAQEFSMASASGGRSSP